MDYQYSDLTKHLAKLSPERQSYILGALPRHLVVGGQMDRAIGLLTDFGFLTAKCSGVAVSKLPDGELKYLGVYELLADYEELLSLLEKNNEPMRSIVRNFELSIREAAHILVRWPDLTFQEIFSRIKLMQFPKMEAGRGNLWKKLVHYISQMTRFIRTLVVRYRRVIFPSRIYRKEVHGVSNAPNELPPVYQDTNVWLEQLNAPLPQSSFVQCFGHLGRINAIEFFHDGRLISFGEDGTARIWDTTNGMETREIRFCGHPLVDGKLAPDETWGIALCSQCGVFKFSVASGEGETIEIFSSSQIARNNVAFRTCDFFPHEPNKIVVSKGDTLWIVDLEKDSDPVPLRANLQDFSGEWRARHLPWDFADRMVHESFGEIACAALDPDSARLMASYSVGGALVWNLIDQKVEAYIPLAWPVLKIVFQPIKSDASWLLGCYNAQGQHLMLVEVNPSWDGGYYVIASEKVSGFCWSLSHDGHFLAGIWLRSTQVVVRHLVDDKSRGEVFLELQHHIGSVTSAAFTRDNRLVASGGEDGIIQVWELQKLKTRANNLPPEMVFDCYFLDSPARIAQLVMDRYDTEPERALLIRYYTIPELEYDYQQSLYGHNAFGHGAFGDIASGQMLKPILLLGRDGSTVASIVPDKSGWVWEITFRFWYWFMRYSLLPRKVLTPTLEIWDARTGAKLFQEVLAGSAPGDWPIDAALSRNGQIIATLSGRGLVTIVNINEKEPVYVGAVEPLHRIAVDCFSDSITVLALSTDTLLQLDWVTLEFEAIWTNISHETLTACCVLPDSRRILIGDSDGQFVLIQLGESSSPEILARWQAHKGSVRSCAVDVTGRICVSAGDDLLCRMWHLDNHHEISKAPIEASVASLAFMEKAGIVIATDENGRFYAWQLKELLINEV